MFSIMSTGTQFGYKWPREYAIPALQWAVGAGVLNGKNDSRLAPTGTATRAEIAAIMQRWCENIIKK